MITRYAFWVSNWSLTSGVVLDALELLEAGDDDERAALSRGPARHSVEVGLAALQNRKRDRATVKENDINFFIKRFFLHMWLNC